MIKFFATTLAILTITSTAFAGRPAGTEDMDCKKTTTWNDDGTAKTTWVCQSK